MNHHESYELKEKVAAGADNDAGIDCFFEDVAVNDHDEDLGRQHCDTVRPKIKVEQ